MTSFPAVATLIGVSQEVAESGPLIATLAVDPALLAASVPPPPVKPVEIKVNDPVTQAVVDNIIGKLPTKKEPVKIKCDLCGITVSGPEVLKIHYAGAKHAKKLKALELVKEIQNSDSTFVSSNGSSQATTEFSCKICKVTLNSYQQLEQHLSGNKHKTKAESSKSNTVEVPDNSLGCKGVMAVDIGPNRLFCAACNVQVNSELQLHQHISSAKHLTKVNGKQTPSVKRLGVTRRNQGFSGGSGRWLVTRGRGRGSWASKNTISGWSPSNSSLGLTGNWSSTPPVNKKFLPRDSPFIRLQDL